jgi:NAD(P)-dependent dehydrogenase (short-subunit alcohol dehydrogenase family)
MPTGRRVARFKEGVAKLTDKQVERISSAIAEPRRFKILKDLAAQAEPMGCGCIVNQQFESEMGKQLVAATPLGRAGQPADIAPAAVFLASDAGAWITGESIRVSGGAY